LKAQASTSEQPSIGVIVQHRLLSSTVQNIARDLDLEEKVAIAVGWHEQALLEAGSRLKAQGVKVLVARGAWWLSRLRRSTGLAVYDYNPDGADLLEVLTRARSIARTIGLIDTYGYDGDWSVFEEALSVRILSEGSLTEPEEGIPRRLATLKEMGARVFVGGQLTVRHAETMGLPALYLESGPRTIRAALQRASEFVTGVQLESARRQVLQTVLDNINEGVVAANTKGEVLAVNRKAVEMAGLKDAMPGGRVSVFPKAWREMLEQPKSDVPVMKSIKGKQIVLEGFPIDVDGSVIGRIVISHEARRLQSAEAYLRRSMYERGFVARHTFDDIKGVSKGIRDAVVVSKQYARTNNPVLILGETGTGKELFAQSIHNASARGHGPFVAVNCAALPESLLESELFGYEEGAFTGARKGGKPGLFEMAHGGTVFLDEISSMSLAVQARLLRVLEERSVVRLGGDTVIPLDIRLIAACNDNLADKVKEGAFREDLFFRLAVLVVEIPPLRERHADLEPLLKQFLGVSEAEPLPFSDKVLQQLRECEWPGNVRQLESFAQRYRALADIVRTTDEAALRAMEGLNQWSKPADSSPQDNWSSHVVQVPIGRMDDMIRSVLQHVSARHSGSLGSLAKQLGMSKSGLWKMLKRHGVEVRKQ